MLKFFDVSLLAQSVSTVVACNQCTKDTPEHSPKGQCTERRQRNQCSVRSFALIFRADCQLRAAQITVSIQRAELTFLS